MYACFMLMFALYQDSQEKAILAACGSLQEIFQMKTSRVACGNSTCLHLKDKLGVGGNS